MSNAMLIPLYVFASFGAAFVLGYSKITLPLRMFLHGASEPPTYHWGRRAIAFSARWFLALLECPACVAFWLGVAAAFTPIALAIPLSAPAHVLAPFLGFANLGAVLSLGLLTGLIRAE